MLTLLYMTFACIDKLVWFMLFFPFRIFGWFLKFIGMILGAIFLSIVSPGTRRSAPYRRRGRRYY